ncbi:MAG: hypothetical protein AB7I18_03240 [Candidatus Berkiella sp.]
MDIHAIRNLAKTEEIDYLFLINSLKDYSQPRNKIQTLLKNQDLIRVKKGLYVFGERARQEPYSKEVLANLIYGPSAISLEYALAFYGLIPERVETVTSITNNRSKSFHTPIGNFEYCYMATAKYSFGITQLEIVANKYFLIATKEKALADILMLRTESLSNEMELQAHLVENLRIEEFHLKELDYKAVSILANLYGSHNVNLLQRFLENNYA